MSANKALLLLLMFAALGGTTSCSRAQTAAHQKSAPPYIPPAISQEALNSLLRENSPKAPPETKSELWAHKVRNRRETFFSIAQWYTGSGMNWPRLMEANPKIDPRRIHVGDTVLIPVDLLKTRSPMPADFPHTKRKRPKTKRPKSPGDNLPEKNEAPALFGPIENDAQPVEPTQNELPALMETLDQ